jgi:hypothetical protein
VGGVRSCDGSSVDLVFEFPPLIEFVVYRVAGGEVSEHFAFNGFECGDLLHADEVAGG